jgi:hypothetical protein
MHTSRVSSPRYSASRVFFCLETASLYSSPTRLTRLLAQLIFHCATVFYAPRCHSRLLARRPHSPTTLDSPRARLAASCASLAASFDSAKIPRRQPTATRDPSTATTVQEERPAAPSPLVGKRTQAAQSLLSVLTSTRASAPGGPNASTATFVAAAWGHTPL